MGYGDVALAVPAPTGELTVIADARPNTAVAPFASTRVGPHAHARRRARGLRGARRRRAGRRASAAASRAASRTDLARGRSAAASLSPSSSATSPSRSPSRPGAMEAAFMDVAEELLDAARRRRRCRRRAPASRSRPCAPPATASCAWARPGRSRTRRPTRSTSCGSRASTARSSGCRPPRFPGGGFGIAPVLGTRGAIAVDTEVGRAGARLPVDRAARGRARARRGSAPRRVAASRRSRSRTPPSAKSTTA